MTLSDKHVKSSTSSYLLYDGVGGKVIGKPELVGVDPALIRAMPLTSCLRYAARFTNTGVCLGFMSISDSLALRAPGNINLKTLLNAERFFFWMSSGSPKLSIADSSSCPVRRQFAFTYGQALTYASTSATGGQ